MKKKKEILNLILLLIYISILILIKITLFKEFPFFFYGILCFVLTFILLVVGGTFYIVWGELYLTERLNNKPIIIKILVGALILLLTIIGLLFIAYVFNVSNSQYHFI